jgi:hypothetical protein
VTRAIVSNVSKRAPDETDPAAGKSHEAASESTASETTAGKPAVEEDEERASTPFDHPFFLPALLIGFTAWFGYDGWLNADFDPQWISFNRWGFCVLFVLAAYFTYQSVRETRGGK